MKWTAAQLPDLSGRTVVVTGANTGIGLATARELAGHGARVVLACRDVERGKDAADRIRLAKAPVDVEVAELDLASMASVREFAAGWSGPLDVLVNNARVIGPPRISKTEDGFELQFGTNHLAHYVLTGLLLPALLAADRPRVVTLASIAHRDGTEAVLDANVTTGYSPQQAYANSKLANLLFALELQREAQVRSLPLISVAAHPGRAALGPVSPSRRRGAGRLVQLAGPAVLRALTQPPSVGARAVLFAATEAAPGSYIGPTRLGETRGPIGPVRPSSHALDRRLAHRLWNASEDFTGFLYPWPR